jgi:uncharacterized Ntn-hydrolase superfamily protein
MNGGADPVRASVRVSRTHITEDSRTVTFSLLGMCRETGMFGAAVTTSSIGVGSRCTFAEAGTGAVLTQHRTDPRLGPRGLELLRAGSGARESMKTLVAQTPTIGWRQLAMVDASGATAWHHGERIKSVHGHAQADGCCAIGNILRNDQVPRAMVDAFAASATEHLAERLVRGLEAGLEAGGELRLLKSAALLVVHDQSFPLVDLRVELDSDPLRQLRYLWELYRPQMIPYVTRAVDPDVLPYPEV